MWPSRCCPCVHRGQRVDTLSRPIWPCLILHVCRLGELRHTGFRPHQPSSSLCAPKCSHNFAAFVLLLNCFCNIMFNIRLVTGFKILRGVKQGDALSCILFIMCMEPLLRNIEENNDILPLECNAMNVQVQHQNHICILTCGC